MSGHQYNLRSRVPQSTPNASKEDQGPSNWFGRVSSVERSLNASPREFFSAEEASGPGHYNLRSRTIPHSTPVKPGKPNPRNWFNKLSTVERTATAPPLEHYTPEEGASGHGVWGTPLSRGPVTPNNTQNPSGTSSSQRSPNVRPARESDADSLINSFDGLSFKNSGVERRRSSHISDANSLEGLLDRMSIASFPQAYTESTPLSRTSSSRSSSTSGTSNHSRYKGPSEGQGRSFTFGATLPSSTGSVSAVGDFGRNEKVSVRFGQPYENLFDQFDNDPSVRGMVRGQEFAKQHFQTPTYPRAPKKVPPPRVPCDSSISSLSSTSEPGTPERRLVLAPFSMGGTPSPPKKPVWNKKWDNEYDEHWFD